jgi:glycosyltransferase involved in cell wall biosynthesis
MKILLLADAPGWIVDRIVDRMIEGIPFEFTKRYYDGLHPAELLELSKQHDLVHYGNWGQIDRFFGVIPQIKKPFLMSVRSFRFEPYVLEAAKKVSHVHIVNPELLEFFPGATYIPDGIFEQFRPNRKFTVGFAGRPDDYKGFDLIFQACELLGVTFAPARGELSPLSMPDYFSSIDLYVCASRAEGASTPVMECLAMNVPVITTNVGIPKFLNVHKVERNVESIAKGIERFYTQKQVTAYNWKSICAQFTDLYQDLVTGKLCST